MTSGPQISIIYHMFPHYRAPVMRALALSDQYQFKFYGSHAPVEGIVAFQGDDVLRVSPLSFRKWKGFGWFGGLFRTTLRREAKAVILIGNPNYPQTWAAALLARAAGKRVLFWTHGWLKPEKRLKALFRNLYFGLADAVLVYDDRAVELAARSGFSAPKVRPIYNSLDWEAASPLYRALGDEGLAKVRARLGLPMDLPVAICTARLTPICRFDLLLDAAAKLKARGQNLKIVLIGDGPERAALESQASKLDLDVDFLGAIYDETQLASWLYAADVTVSPGKVGLTAMHSLTYGTPVVTHSDRDAQMPEVEAIVSGKNGAFFKSGDVEGLVEAISDTLKDPRSREEIRQACRTVMEDRYTPNAQRRRIVAVLDQLLETKSA